MNKNGPLIIQSDYTFLLEVEHVQYADCRDFLLLFTELVKSPEYIHTYRVTPLSLWNAAALEVSLSRIVDGLESFSKYSIPSIVLASLEDWYQQYGKLVLEKENEEELRLTINDDTIFSRLLNNVSLQYFCQHTEAQSKSFLIKKNNRGNIKQALIQLGYPVNDLCGYLTGDAFSIQLRDTDLSGNTFHLRSYQKEAIEAFYQNGKPSGGNGIIVLPCGSGKTIIGLGACAAISNCTLIITTNNVSVHQWKNELIQKTHVSPDDIGEFTGVTKEIKPITITTYQMLTWRKSSNSNMDNLELFNSRNWGLIIYDEVHTLPAPVFRATTEIQAKRRLGLTATLIREDGKEDEVFALIGPKRYDIPWKTLESLGFIAQANCFEIRVKFHSKLEKEYIFSDKRNRYRVAAENPNKINLLFELLEKHKKDQILIIGQYISQLDMVAAHLNAPVIMGKTKNADREKIYDQFRNGEIPVLIVSKVANFAVDLPDANVLIQISGSYGSRQEEAQRLGRILRPKKKSSYFYSLVTHNTDEQEFSSNRQLFLVEQGYKYHIHYYG